MRYGVRGHSRIDKPLLRRAVVEAADLVGRSGNHEWLHRIESLQPQSFHLVEVDRLCEIESCEVLGSNLPAPSQQLQEGRPVLRAPVVHVRGTASPQPPRRHAHRACEAGQPPRRRPMLQYGSRDRRTRSTRDESDGTYDVPLALGPWPAPFRGPEPGDSSGPRVARSRRGTLSPCSPCQYHNPLMIEAQGLESPAMGCRTGLQRQASCRDRCGNVALRAQPSSCMTTWMRLRAGPVRCVACLSTILGTRTSNRAPGRGCRRGRRRRGSGQRDRRPRPVPSVVRAMESGCSNSGIAANTSGGEQPSDPRGHSTVEDSLAGGVDQQEGGVLFGELQFGNRSEVAGH